MAALKRNRGTWILILLLATGFFLLRERRGVAGTTAAPGLTINAPTPFSALDNGPDDSNPALGIFEYCGDLTITSAGSISCDEVGTPASACDINMVILGNLVIQEGGSIHADNVGNNGGSGGNITLDIGGPRFTMCGPSSTTLGCANLPNPGAIVSAQQAGGGNGQGGDILIRVGGVKTIPDPVSPTSPAIGVCDSPVICGVNIPLNTGDALIEDKATALLTPATIIADAASGHAGDIGLYTGHDITVHGVVHSQGFQGAGHGGAITLDACCTLLIGDTGEVTSRGQDPGPDRVHLEACTVSVFGLVQSTGPAHEDPAPNCTPPARPDRPANSTACVEIWAGTTVTISSVLPHKAEVNADVGFAGGTSGRGWIDILSNGNSSLQDGTGDNFVNPLIPSPDTNFMVHANMNGLTNGTGGLIAVISKFGSVSTVGSTVGEVLQANANSTAGGDGGAVTVLAGGVGSPGGDVTWGTAQIEARGFLNSTGAGGLIAIRSHQGNITGTVPGSLNASGDLAASPGVINLTACAGAIAYSGTETPVANRFMLVCAPLNPAFPAPAQTQLPLATCAQSCAPQTPTPTPTNTRVQLLTPTPGNCPEDPNAVMTRTIDPSGTIHQGLPNHLTVQAAYNAMANSGETVGMFGNTVENVTLGGTKSGKITQCTSARITAASSGLPVWSITSTGKLLIQGPDSVGGSIGWFINNATGGPHTLKSVRANGASTFGIAIQGIGKNEVSWNDVSGNGLGGIRVFANSNILKGGTVGPNSGNGVELTSNSNTLSGATVEGNTGFGVVVVGNTNQIKGNKANSNGSDGFRNFGGTGNNYSGNSSNTGGKENGGAEYRFTTAGVNGGSNRADGVNVPSAAKGCTSFNAGQVCE